MEYGNYAFGLTEEQERRAQRIHDDSIIVDLTFQGPTSPDVWTSELRAELDQAVAATADRNEAINLPYTFLLNKARKGEYPEYREFFAASGVTCGVEGFELGGTSEPSSTAVGRMKTMHALPWLRPAFTAEDIRAAHDADHHALLGMCQYNHLMPGQLDQIDQARELGLVTLDCCYNTMTWIGAGCTERYDPGLSHFGLRFVERCNTVGVIVDTAHSGRQTTLDACAASTQPVVATHTAAEAIYQHDRGKSDEELRAIADTGGVIGVVAVPFFLSPPPKPATMDTMLDHIDHIASLVGTEHVAIGTDWPLAAPTDIQVATMSSILDETGFRDEHGVEIAATLDGFRDPRDWPNITRGLVARGYSDEAIVGILGENFLRVMASVCD